MKIKLKKYGKFFSGRSIAEEILQSIKITGGSEIEIDFTGVEWATQSFISELIYQLKNKGFDVTQIRPVGCVGEINERINKEIKRIA